MKRKSDQAGKVMRMRYAYCTVAVQVTLLALLAWGCTSQDMTETKSQAVDEPIEELAYGADICDFSGEPIETVRYGGRRSEEHTSELQSRGHLVCRLLLEKKK